MWSATAVGTAAAYTRAPAICTSVNSRYGTSSASWADANHVKFIHAHQMPKNAMKKPTTPSPRWPATSSWCRAPAPWATAMTNDRSTKSSSGVDERCSSPGSRTTGPTLMVGRDGIAGA